VTDPWWADVSPVEVEVPCGAGRHTLRWEAGRLLTPAHPDPDGEAVLAALGGDEPECLRLRRAWESHAGDSRLLVLGSRHPGDELNLRLDDVLELRSVPAIPRGGPYGRAARARFAIGSTPMRPASPGRPGGPPRLARWVPLTAGPASAAAVRPPWLDDAQWEAHVELLSLLALDARLQRRLQAHVAAHLLELPDRSARAALEAATIGRLRPVLERWRPAARARAAVGETPGVDPDGLVTVRRDWLVAVWCRYLSLVDGFLVLDVHRSVPGRAEVTAAPATTDSRLARLTVAGPAPWRVVERE
jgi:hypothetical protein